MEFWVFVGKMLENLENSLRIKESHVPPCVRYFLLKYIFFCRGLSILYKYLEIKMTFQ